MQINKPTNRFARDLIVAELKHGDGLDVDVAVLQRRRRAVILTV